MLQNPAIHISFIDLDLSMRAFRQCTRLLLLYLLVVSVFVPILLLSSPLSHLTSGDSKEFIEDFWNTKFRTDAHTLNSVGEESGGGVQEPALLVYKDRKIGSILHSKSPRGKFLSDKLNNTRGGDDLDKKIGTISVANETIQERQPKNTLPSSKKEANKRDVGPSNADKRLKLMKDQLIMAKAYLSFAPPSSNSYLVKLLKLRKKELERSISTAIQGSDLSEKALRRMRLMRETLMKASLVYSDCSAMEKKLRAMTYTAEEQLRTQQNQESFLVHLAGRSTSKGRHCLSMRLTAEYFALQPQNRQLLNQQKIDDLDLYHFALFSDNILACAAAIDSTISSALDPERIVLHVVTNSLNLPAFLMWFISNPPGNATIQIQSIDEFDWLLKKYNHTTHSQNLDPRYTSPLNHLRFFLPDIFPGLNKIVLLDHDVIVQKDLTQLWSVDLKGKVNGAVETCKKDNPFSRQISSYINFSDPIVAERFYINACTWAFGMNVFDLQQWRTRNLTGVYYEYLQLGKTRTVWLAGSLAIGWATFYNETIALDSKWHLLGLGYDSDHIKLQHIEEANVIHYNGPFKPWLDIGFEDYRQYWTKHVKYNHPFLQQCNIT